MEETHHYVTQVDYSLNRRGRLAPEEEKWKLHSIYKLPPWVTNVNDKAYKPRLISFGPYHFGDTYLMPMENHKHRALLYFLKRSGKRLRDCFEAVKPVLEDLKAAYSFLDPKWERRRDDFLVVMIRDGCFMLEILRRDHRPSLYDENDPIFSVHGEHLVPFIKRDMLLLENQLPMFLLDKLLSFEDPQPQDQGDEDERINELIINFCSPTDQNKKLGKCKHILDAYRKCLLWEENREPSIQVNVAGGESTATTTRETQFPPGVLGFIFPPPPPKIWVPSIVLPPAKHFPVELQLPSATELHEAGITIKPSRTGNIKGISFDRGTLRLPRILVDDAAETVFLNLIAFERFHPGIGDEVTSYVAFMNDIIDTAKDVNLLQSLGIIHNAVGSEEALAKLFNSLATDVPLNAPGSLSDVRKKAAIYAKKSWNQWRANLIHTYFSNPWTILSVIAAVLLFGLTIIQTVYTMGQFYQGQ